MVILTLRHIKMNNIDTILALAEALMFFRKKISIMIMMIMMPLFHNGASQVQQCYSLLLVLVTGMCSVLQQSFKN